MSEEAPFFIVRGKEYCNESYCLSVLLRDNVLFCNERDYYSGDKKDGSTTVLFVICNDVFWWGTADAEDLPNDEIGNLYRMHIADPKYGSDKWCCRRRNLKPQVPLVEIMKKDGAWEEWMDGLGDPGPS